MFDQIDLTKRLFLLFGRRFCSTLVAVNLTTKGDGTIRTNYFGEQGDSTKSEIVNLQSEIKTDLRLKIADLRSQI